MRTILLSVFVMVLGLTSCTLNEITADRYENNAIEFGTYTGNAVTKGVVTDGTNLVEFAVTAFHTGETQWNDNAYVDEVPDFMYNQSVSRADASSSWGYSPIKYWPTNTGDKVSFFAHAPKDNDYAVLSGNAYKGTPTVTVTIPSTTADMIDFVADAAIDKTNSNTDIKPAAVAFNLQHEMTRLSIVAKLDENLVADNKTDASNPVPYSTVVITSIDFPSGAYYYPSGKYTFPEDNETTTRGSWDFTGITATELNLNKYLNFTANQTYSGKTYGSDELTLGLTTTDPVNLLAQSTGNPEQYLFLLPPNGVTGLSTTQVLSISYDIVTEDEKLSEGYSLTSATKTVTLPATFFKQGTAYKITLTFNIDDIELEASVVDWLNEEYAATIDYDNDNSTATVVTPAP